MNISKEKSLSSNYKNGTHWHSFNHNLAIDLGLNAALILNYLSWSITYHEDNRETYEKNYFFEGKWWTKSPIKGIKNHFSGIISDSTIKTAISKLKEVGLVISTRKYAKFNDQTSWYTIDYNACDKLVFRPKSNKSISQKKTVQDRSKDDYSDKSNLGSSFIPDINQTSINQRGINPKRGSDPSDRRNARETRSPAREDVHVDLMDLLRDKVNTQVPTDAGIEGEVVKRRPGRPPSNHPKVEPILKEKRKPGRPSKAKVQEKSSGFAPAAKTQNHSSKHAIEPKLEENDTPVQSGTPPRGPGRPKNEQKATAIRSYELVEAEIADGDQNRSKGYFCESDLLIGRRWFAFALKQMPWTKPRAGWSEEKFAAAIYRVRKNADLNAEGVEALFDYIRKDMFWSQNAISPIGLLKASEKTGIRKIDTILNQMKPKFERQLDMMNEAGDDFVMPF